MRIRVIDVLELLAAGLNPKEILADYPYLEADDIVACIQFAATGKGPRREVEQVEKLPHPRAHPTAAGPSRSFFPRRGLEQKPSASGSVGW